jgi:hypothetical protein
MAGRKKRGLADRAGMEAEKTYLCELLERRRKCMLAHEHHLIRAAHKTYRNDGNERNHELDLLRPSNEVT